MKFVVCMDNTHFGDFSGDDLTIGHLYEVIDDVDRHNMLRIIDDSGEDYLYPAVLFETVNLSANTAERLHRAFNPANE